MRSPRFPAWVGVALLVGLTLASLSTYLAGDWRNGDVVLYHDYALGFWGGLSHPLLPVEYPPLSILPFSLTLLGPSTWYPDVFAFWMAVIAVAGYLAIRRWGSSSQAAAYAVYALGAGAATLVFRFDIVPALATVMVIWLAQRRRFTLAYVLLGLAVLLKLFPAALVPVLAIAQWRAGDGPTWRRGRTVAGGVATCVAVVLAGFALAGLAQPHGWLSSLDYELHRPVEVGSVPATLMWVASLVGVKMAPVVSFGAFNVAGSLSTPLVISALCALATGAAVVVWRQARGHWAVEQAATAMILVVLCTSKVLSPQYILWLAPLLAITMGFQLRWFAVCLLTSLVFPTLFEAGVATTIHGPTYSALLLGGIAVRNVLLVVLTLQLLRTRRGPGWTPAGPSQRNATNSALVA